MAKPVKIVSCVTNDLTTDQRVHRAAQLLHSKGYKVTLFGRKLPASNQFKRDYTTTRSKLWFNKGGLFYANYNIRLLFKLMSLKPDIVLANDLDTLLGAYCYAKLFNKQIIFDSHEYFPEVPELIGRDRVKNFWLGIEKRIVPNLKYCITVSPAIVVLFKDLYNVDFKLLRNLPTSKSVNIQDKKAERKKLGLPDSTFMIIYQGALNIGRGIELAIDAVNLLSDCILVIAGKGDIEDELKQKVEQNKLANKVVFTGALSPEELLNYTQVADMGFSLEEDMGLNYRFALPNKLFDYVQARIPVLVSDLPVMKQIVEEYKVGKVLIGERNPENLSKAFNELLNTNPDKFNVQLENAAKTLNWENEQKVLLDILEEVTKN